MRTDKGTAGLSILISVIVLLFMIGFLAMLFALMSGEIGDAVYTSDTGTATNETLTTVCELGEDFTYSGLRDVICTISIVTNATDGVIIEAGNYTQTNCNLLFSGEASSYMNNTNWNVSYTYTYSGDTEASDVINETSGAIADVTDWFPIIIVITAMIVLILLTVIIITAIRGSNLISTSA